MLLDDVIDGSFIKLEFSEKIEGMYENLELLYLYKQKASRPIYIVKCRICAKDKELFGDGIFKARREHLARGIRPCGCGKNVRWSMEQYKVLMNRKLIEQNVKFVSYVDDGEKGLKAKCNLHCEEHNITFTKRVAEIVRGFPVLCPECSFEVRQSKARRPDEEMIQEFRKSGSFHEGTVFTRSNRVSKSGKMIYWHVDCPICGVIGESASSDLKSGKICCGCGKQRQNLSYLIALKDGDLIIALKFGITRDLDKRLKDHAKNCIYDVELIGSWKFSSIKDCKGAEKECKQTLICGVLTKQEFREGHTETTYTFNYEAIKQIYEKFGGNLLTNPTR